MPWLIFRIEHTPAVMIFIITVQSFMTTGNGPYAEKILTSWSFLIEWVTLSSSKIKN